MMGLAAVGIVLCLRKNRCAPAAVVLVALGVGLIEISVGLFLARSIGSLFAAFPSPIMGAMMLLVGPELVKSVREVHWGTELMPLGVTVAASLLTNMAVGFAAGVAAHYLLRALFWREGS